MKITVIERIVGQFERDWLHELLDFPDVQFDFVDSPDLAQIVPNSLVAFNHTINYTNYFARCQNAGAPFGAIHLSDELLRDDCRFYSWEACRFVFRNYWHPIHATNPKVTSFGLGYKVGFWSNYRGPSPADITIDQRSNQWVFAGCIHSQERVVPLQTFRDLRPHAVHFNQRFDSPEGLPIEEYRNWLLDARFALCPRGATNLDCFRLYEAMEAGAIPVALSRSDQQPLSPSYWYWAFGRSPPFIHRETWPECLAEVQELLANPGACEERRRQVVQFWRDMKSEYKKKLRSKIELLR